MSHRRYDLCRASGVEWLGELPAHWQVKQLKHVAKIGNGSTPSRDNPDYWEGGTFPWLSSTVVNRDNVDESEEFVTDLALKKCTLPIVEPPAVLVGITGQGKTRGMAATLRFTATINQHIAYLKPDQNFIDVDFLRRVVDNSYDVLRTDSEGAGATKGAITCWQLANLPFPYPPYGEQRAIATFLDRETAKIDDLIAEQERLIALLAEKRQAVVAHAVTKGLDPTVEMKDSGVEWLGQIPSHWDVCQSRRMFAVRSEPALPSDQMLTASQKYGVLYQAEFVELEGRRVVEVILGVENLRHVEPDDFIISMRSFQGGIEWSRLRGSTSFHYVMLRPVKYVYPPFFAHLFKSICYIQALRTTTDLIRDGQELRYSNFVKIDLPVVPLEEQAAIASYLDEEVGKLDALAVQASRAVSLLRERRTALISAAVTGKIDVRERVPVEAP